MTIDTLIRALYQAVPNYAAPLHRYVYHLRTLAEQGKTPSQIDSVIQFEGWEAAGAIVILGIATEKELYGLLNDELRPLYAGVAP